MLFVEEVANDSRLLLAASQMRAGVGDHLRLIARPLLPHSLLGVLVEQLIWIEFRAVAWFAATATTSHDTGQADSRLPPPTCELS